MTMHDLPSGCLLVSYLQTTREGAGGDSTLVECSFPYGRAEEEQDEDEEDEEENMEGEDIKRRSSACFSTTLLPWACRARTPCGRWR
jgi:hypothetical protein